MSTLTFFNLDYIIDRFGCKVFVETGLGDGNGIAFASKYPFEWLFSSEIDEKTASRFKNCLMRYLPRKERIIVGVDRSVNFLQNLLPKLCEADSILFWLDAHFPGSNNGKDYLFEKDKSIRFPLEQEIEIINEIRPNNKDVIIIDDLRVYKKGNCDEKNSLEECGLDYISHYDNKIFDKLKPRFQLYEINLDTGYLVCFPKK